MKKRIISSILVVVMLVLSLVSCGYSYSKDDMTQYMTFNKDAFAATLNALEYEDGKFTTNEETRKAKIEKYIYDLLLGRVASDAEKLTEGTIGATDKLYYRYYATFEKDGQTIVVYPSKMVAASTSDYVALGNNELTGKDKAIRDTIVDLIAKGELGEIKTYIYEPKTVATADSEGKTDAYKEDTKTGTVAYVTYTKSWKDAEGKDQSKTFKYERVVLGETNFAAIQLVGSKIGTNITDKVKVNETEEARTNEENGIVYTYTALKVDAVVPVIDIAENDKGVNNEIIVEYKTENELSLSEGDFVTKPESTKIPSGTTLKYHVNPAYYNDVEENSADLILKELLAKLPVATVKDEDGNDTTEARELPCLENAEEELKAFNEALTAFNTAKSAYDSAVKAEADAKAAYEKVQTNNANDAAAVETAKGTYDAKVAETATKLTEKNTAEATLNEKLAAVYAKINADTAAAKATVVSEFEKLVKDVLTEQYNDEVKTNIAKAVWAAMKANSSVTSHPEKAVKETYDRMFETYQVEFYTGKDGSVTNYSKYGGEFESFLIEKMKKHADVPDAANFVTDYTNAKHALWSLAKQYVSDIVIIYYVADIYDLTYDKSEIKDFKNADDRFYDASEPEYGENNVLAAHQFDGVMDYFLEVEKDEQGNVKYDETTGAPKYIRIPKK